MNIENSQSSQTPKDKLPVAINAMLYAGLKAPAQGLAQVSDKVFNTNLTKKIDTYTKNLGIETPKEYKFGSGKWLESTIGQSIGMMIPFMTCYKGLASIGEDSVLLESLGQSEKNTILSGGAGLIYGGIMTPVENNSLKSHFSSAFKDMTTFAVLGASNELVNKGFAKLDVKNANLLGKIIDNTVAKGAISGLFTGSTLSFIDAFEHGKITPTFKSLKQNALTMSLLGSSFGAADSLLENTAKINNNHLVDAADSKISQPKFTSNEKYDLVLGVGGSIAAYEGAGALKALKEAGVHIDNISGASAGADLAALAANGYDGDEILKINLANRDNFISNPSVFMSSLIWPNPSQWFISKSFISLEQPWQNAVRELNLRPQENLKIWAFDPINRKPIVFEGTNYDLARALAATGAYPNIFAPVMHNGYPIVDGGLYKANTDEFSKNRAFVFKFTNNLNLDSSTSKPDSIIVDLRRYDESPLNFTLPTSKARLMFDDGYRKTLSILKKLQG